MNYTGKKFSLLGDSVSTFKGYTEGDAVFYGRAMCEKGGLSGVDDTWWMRVIHALGGQLDTNNSFSGSCVAEAGFFAPASSEERCGALGTPEVILIHMGANDAGFAVPIAEFESAYRLMLSRLQARYPAAELWCCTHVNGRKVLPEEPYFGGEDPSVDLTAYNEVIRRCAAESGAELADVAATGLIYDAIDGAHPTSGGMQALADAILLYVKA